MLDTWRMSGVLAYVWGPGRVECHDDVVREPEDAEVPPLRDREQSRAEEGRDREKDTASNLPQGENEHKFATALPLLVSVIFRSFLLGAKTLEQMCPKKVQN